MKRATTVAELRAALAPARAAGSIGFVPTMGALHAGHLSLVHAARDAHDVVVVSIFVNPLQFGPTEDFERYPRDLEKDLPLLEEAGVDVVFLPSVEEMYRPGRQTTVDPGPLGDVLEGAERPGHFHGVATVVAKLFNIVEPDASYFGQKDAQQVAVIQQMVRDLSLRTHIVVGPTIREPDGLALSSRNAYLSPQERAIAPALARSLEAGRDSLQRGEGVDVAEKNMWEVLTADARVVGGYARVVDPVTFGPPTPGNPALLVVAARIGTTHLIDNLLFEER